MAEFTVMLHVLKIMRNLFIIVDSCKCLTGRMTPASLWQWLCWRRAQPAVGLSVKYFDLVAIDFVVGVERTETICSTPKYKHLCSDDCGWVEVSPTCWSALWRKCQWIMGWISRNKQTNNKKKAFIVNYCVLLLVQSFILNIKRHSLHYEGIHKLCRNTTI